MIGSSQRSLTDNTQHSQQTNIQALGGIQTHDRSRRAAVDLRLRPRGHWDQKNLLAIQILKVLFDCILPKPVSFVVFGINITYVSVCLSDFCTLNCIWMYFNSFKRQFLYNYVAPQISYWAQGPLSCMCTNFCNCVACGWLEKCVSMW